MRTIVVLLVFGLVALFPVPAYSQEDAELDCANSVTQYFHVGDSVQLWTEYWFSGVQLVEDPQIQPYVYIDYDISATLLEVVGGPVCSATGKRSWHYQLTYHPEISGWMSDGYQEGGQEVVFFEVVSVGSVTSSGASSAENLLPDSQTPVGPGSVADQLPHYRQEPDGYCPEATTEFVLHDLVVPTRADTRILPFGPLAASWSWFQWSTGSLEITAGPVCDGGVRLWYVQDDNYQFGGWVIEVYHSEPNIALASTEDQRADPDEGYSTTLQMVAPQ